MLRNFGFCYFPGTSQVALPERRFHSAVSCGTGKVGLHEYRSWFQAETHAESSQLVPSPIFPHFRNPFNQHGKGKKLNTKLIKPGNHVQVNVTEINCQQVGHEDP
jgi:hypothetical protein